MADARAGVVAAVHAGRVGAQNGIVARALEAMVDAGAHVEDVSVLLGPAVSGAQLRGARRRWPPRSRRRCRAAGPPPRRARRRWTCGPESPAAHGFGRPADRRRPAVHGRRPQSVQSSARRADRTAGLAGVDGMTAPRKRADANWPSALAALRAALDARRGGGRTRRRRNRTAARSPSSSRPPMSLILRRLGCRPSANRANRRRRKGRRSRGASLRDCTPAFAGTWSARSSATRPRRSPAWAYAAHSVDSAERGRRARTGRRRRRCADGRRTEPLRVYLQLSLDGDTSRGGVDVDDPDCVDELCAPSRRRRRVWSSSG